MNLKKLSAAQIKELCTAEKFAALSENELIEMFRYINHRILCLEGCFKLEERMEKKWWDCAYALLDTEVCKRGLCLTYIGFTDGMEGATALQLLDQGEDGIEDAYALLDQLNVLQLKNVETEIAKVVSKRPYLYRPYLERIREALKPLTGNVLN